MRVGLLTNEDSSLLEAKVVDTAMVLNGLFVICEIVFSLQSKDLRVACSIHSRRTT